MTTVFPGHIALDAGPAMAIDLALFAASSGDHNPLHLDPDVASLAGFDRPVVHGMLSMAYVGRLLTQHFGAGSVRSFTTKFTGVALRGDRIRLTGTLVAEESGTAHYRIRAETEAGTQVLSGEARVYTR